MHYPQCNLTAVGVGGNGAFRKWSEVDISELVVPTSSLKMLDANGRLSGNSENFTAADLTAEDTKTGRVGS